jgi:hypothetical protein
MELRIDEVAFIERPLESNDWRRAILKKIYDQSRRN